MGFLYNLIFHSDDGLFLKRLKRAIIILTILLVIAYVFYKPMPEPMFPAIENDSGWNKKKELFKDIYTIDTWQYDLEMKVTFIKYTDNLDTEGYTYLKTGKYGVEVWVNDRYATHIQVYDPEKGVSATIYITIGDYSTVEKSKQEILNEVYDIISCMYFDGEDSTSTDKKMNDGSGNDKIENTGAVEDDIDSINTQTEREVSNTTVDETASVVEKNIYPYSDGEWYYIDENTAVIDDRYVYSSMDDFYNDYSGSWKTDAEGDPGSYYFPLYFGTAGPSTVYEVQFQLHYDYGQHWNPNTNVVYEMENSMYCQYCDAYYMTE